MDRLVRARVLLAQAEALGVTIDDLVAAASSSSAASLGGEARRAVAPVPTLAEYVDTVAPSFSANTAATYRAGHGCHALPVPLGTGTLWITPQAPW